MWGLAYLAERLPPADAAQLLADALAKVKAGNAKVHVVHRQLIAKVLRDLAMRLAATAGRLSLADAAAICAPAAHQLAQTLAKEMDVVTRGYLAEGLAAVAEQLAPADAAVDFVPVARHLAEALVKETNDDTRRQLARGLMAVGGRLPPVDATAICAPVARQLAKEATASDNYWLARALASTVDYLPADEAARILVTALARATDHFSTCCVLAEGLAEVTGRLPPDAAAAVCAPAARQLAEAVVKHSEGDEHGELAMGLAAVAGRLPPADATRLLAEVLSNAANADACQELIRGLIRAADLLGPLEAEQVKKQALGVLRRRDANARFWEEPMSYKGAMSSVVQSLTDAKAHGIAIQQGSQIMAVQEPHAKTLDRLLTEVTPHHRCRHAVAMTTAVSLAFGGPLPALFTLPAASEPLPCRLSTAELVEWLKYPTCFGAARQVVLDHLGNRYRRRFDTHWDFVRYAQQQRLGLDFTTPPKRPEQKLPPLFAE